MRDVKSLGPDECIGCQTEEEAKAICKLMHEAGLKRCNGDNYLDKTNWNFFVGNKACYYPKEGTYEGMKDAIKDKSTIYPASDFLQDTRTPKRGDRVLVSAKNNLRWCEKIYLTTIEGADYPYICVSSGNETFYKEGLPFSTTSWQVMKPLEEKKERKLMMTDPEREKFQKENGI